MVKGQEVEMIEEYGAVKLASMLGRFTVLAERLAEDVNVIAKHLHLGWAATSEANAAAELRRELWDTFPEAFKNSPREKPHA